MHLSSGLTLLSLLVTANAKTFAPTANAKTCGMLALLSLLTTAYAPWQAPPKFCGMGIQPQTSALLHWY
jgi:hypothetical protein